MIQRWNRSPMPLGPVAEPCAVHQTALQARVAEQAVDVDEGPARAEPVVGDGDDRRVALRGQLKQPADALVERPEADFDLLVPAGLVDPRLIDVEIGPEPVLEAVEVMEVNHQGRPVAPRVGPLGRLGLGVEDRPVPRRLRRQVVERPGPGLPDDLVGVVGDFAEDLGGQTRGTGRMPTPGWANRSPRRSCR